MENNDSVCYIAKISEIKSIENADKIELATINGWNSIVQRGKWDKTIQDRLVLGYINDTKVPYKGIVVKCITGDREKVSKCINPEYYTFSEKYNIEENGH